ncbi:MAG: hypothetical protein O2797_06810 [Bacteroidetes bacterium]|nr:hypothetical protein [Bacteroidota bacterium]MDA1333912.1 hypothetical protein [Bacteroidota bacterium]
MSITSIQAIFPFNTSKTLFSRRYQSIVGATLAWSLLVAGCTTTRAPSSVATAEKVETIAFTSMADRIDIVDQATSTLIRANFAITLANDRIGLVQSDYIPLSSVQASLADTLAPVADFKNLLMRVAVNAERGEETKFVQVKGTFQRIAGVPKQTDELIGLYWLEQLASNMAEGVDAPFAHQVSDSTYQQLLGQVANPVEETKSPGVGGAIKVVGVLVAVLFVVQLASGAFGPTSSPAPSQ